MDLGRDEQWLGEAVAESLGLALLQVPALVQIDRGRLKTLPQPESWTEQSAQSAARALSADVALYGEVRRSAGDLSILPRFVEVKGDQGRHGTLERGGGAGGRAPGAAQDHAPGLSARA
jgi:TolB-like protein